MQRSQGDQAVALVTGAGGELGSAIARRFQQLGFKVIAFERDAQAAAKAASGLGEEAIGIAADQTNRSEVDAAIDQIRQRFGRLDAVVANAGYAKFGSVMDMPDAIWERHVAVNLNGTFRVCQAAARLMASCRSGGSIVVVSSSLALAHSDDVAAYCTSKAALLPLVRSMAAELGTYGIRVNAILPGVVETSMTGEMLRNDNVREDLLQRTPVGRLGRPEDIADAVEFLCSAKSAFITGATLAVDGGQSIYGEPRWRRQDRSVTFEPRSLDDLGNRP